MKPRFILLVTALLLISLAGIGGMLTYHRLQGLAEHATGVEILLHAVDRVAELRNLLNESPSPFVMESWEFLSASQAAASPLIFAAYERVQHALQSQDVAGARDALTSLEGLLLQEARRKLKRAERRTVASSQDLLRGFLIAGPVLTALLAGLVLALVFRPLGQAGRAVSPAAAAVAVSNLSYELAELLRGLSARSLSARAECSANSNARIFRHC